MFQLKNVLIVLFKIGIMKKCIVLVLLLVSSLSKAQNQEIQKTIETFFEGMHSRDTLKIKSVCANDLILQSIIEMDTHNKIVNEKPKQFYKSITEIPKFMVFEEKILSYNINIDRTLAQVWTPYEFYLNDKLSHKGVNCFTLFKENDTWKIIYIIDTRRK